MRTKYTIFLKSFLLLLFLNISSAYAINDLVARVPGNYTQMPAFIEDALLVSEPHGGYVEHSLYLQYSDHNAFPGSQTVEIIHRFELPEGSVINDLWLWMGNNIMRARMMDEWSARKIYDSVVSMKRDPAFLTKIGNQYELHIYPLVSGSFRKIKINFITPTKWIGENASSELPLKFLKASASTQMPLNIYFRTTLNIWGIPGINELPNQTFTQFTDTAGYNYKRTLISDIMPLQSFNLSFTTAFNNGVFFSNNVVPNDYNYFQFGILPWKAFNETTLDSLPKKVIAGIDLSGSHYKDFSTLLPNIKASIKASLRQGDLFNIIVSGAGKIVPLNSSLIPYSSSMVDSLINKFSASSYGDSVALQKMPNILYCDYDAYTIWNFSDMGNYATTQYNFNMMSALPSFSAADIVCNYDEGFENVLSGDDASSVIKSLDSLFLRGGRYLTYYDHNRDGREYVATHYIPNITVKYSTQSTVSISRNLNGNIGKYFPESLMHGGGYFFDISQDTSLKAEMVDDQGNPCIFSKRVGNNGLIVVTGIWPFNDDVPMRQILAVPLLGLNAIPGSNMLIPLLQNYSQLSKDINIDKFITFTNNDSLATTDGTDIWVNNYLNNYPSKPVFNSINLLDGSSIAPPSVTIAGNEYYGNGYLMQRLADNSRGKHFETHLIDWPTIAQGLVPSAHKLIDSLNVSPALQSVHELMEVNSNRSDPDRPLFFLASTSSWDQIDMKVAIKFAGDTAVKFSTFNYKFSVDTTNNSRIVPSMMGNEKLKNMFLNTPTDTSGIVKLAIKYNLLCDYTGLIALEPNDTIHFMVNPYDESNFNDVTEKDSTLLNNYSLAQNYPNPFNPSTVINYNIPKAGNVSLKVYDILGNEVRVLVNAFKGAGRYNVRFESKGLASGIYIYRLTVDKFSLNRKMLLLK